MPAILPMRIALYEPDIPQNTGTILRLAACLGLEAHIIEPAGFATSDRAFRRAGMDYLDQVEIVRHVSWEAFEAWRAGAGARLILFTTRAHHSDARRLALTQRGNGRRHGGGRSDAANRGAHGRQELTPSQSIRQRGRD